MRKRWTSRAISVMRGINRRVRGNKEEAKGVAKSAVYHVASAMEATFPGRRRAGQTPPHHGKVASFSRVPSPASGNSGHDPKQDCPNSTEILGTGAMTPAEDLARRLGISAEMVEHIVEDQLAEDRVIDPERVITAIGLGELSLKKRHRLYATVMTDLSDPTRPKILAVARGKDMAAAVKCLDRLSEEQRQQVRTHRVDMGSAYPAACAERLKHSRAVTDRFHVAKKFNEVVDALRKN